MKKLFILMGVIYVISFISCTESNEKKESFAEFLKDTAKLDSMQRKELLIVANSINHIPAPTIIPPDDIINEAERRQIRLHNNIVLHPTDIPIIKISMGNMEEIIAALNPQCDTLVFCLGGYKHPISPSPGERDRLKRYIDKNPGLKDIDLRNAPTFVITGKLRGSPMIPKSLLHSTSYDVAKLCPPPYGGGCE